MSEHHTDKPVCGLCEEKLKSAHSFMADWFRKKKLKYRNMHISWAYRNKAEQEAAFSAGASSLHYPQSKHNFTVGGIPCSLALDIFQLTEDGVAVFSRKFCELLDRENQADLEPMRWGGRFKLKNGSDANHFECLLDKI